MNDNKPKNYVSATTYVEPENVRYVSGEVIPPATTADVRTPGKALDTDDMVTLLTVMGAVLLVLIGARGMENDWAISAILFFWAVFMAVFVVLVMLIQSRTLVQLVVTFLHWGNEWFRLLFQVTVAKRHYAYLEYSESEQTERHRMTTDSSRLIADAKIAEQQLTIRRIADGSRMPTQNHSNQLATYAQEPTEQPYVDLFKADVLSYLIELTETDERGNPRYVTNAGRISTPFPWSTRGEKANEAERFWRLMSVVSNAAGDWVVRNNGKAYYFNIEKMDKDCLLDVFAKITSDGE